MGAQYLIRHKRHDNFYFGGFNPDGSIRWEREIESAWKATRLMAKAQAALLICNNVPVRREVSPVGHNDNQFLLRNFR